MTEYVLVTKGVAYDAFRIYAANLCKNKKYLKDPDYTEFEKTECMEYLTKHKGLTNNVDDTLKVLDKILSTIASGNKFKIQLPNSKYGSTYYI